MELFEGTKNWDLDWHNYVWGDELKLLLDQLKTVACCSSDGSHMMAWPHTGAQHKARLPRLRTS